MSILMCIMSINLHLLSLAATIGSGSGAGFVKSSKLIIKSDISSISERIGAITSEQRNFCPETQQENIILPFFSYSYINTNEYLSAIYEYVKHG